MVYKPSNTFVRENKNAYHTVVPGHLFQCVYELMTKTRHFEVSKKGDISEEDYGVKVMVT